MCLNSKTDKPCIAEEDITCYKVLDRCDGFFCKCKTPFRGVRVRNAVLTGRRLMKARGKREISNNIFNLYQVNGGYIHTYKDFPFSYHDIGCFLFECVIPKGEAYFESYDGREYASRSIRFVSQVF